MQSTTLKSACLTIGLVTAWSPLGDSTARADTIPVTVNLSIFPNVSGMPFTEVYVGFSLSDTTAAVHSLGDLTGVNNLSFNTAFETGDPLSYVVIGRDGSHVQVSFMDSTGAIGTDFDSLFGVSEASIVTALQFSNTAVIDSFIADLLDRTDAPQVPGLDTDLVRFSDGASSGFLNLSIEPQLVVVPLPAGVMMGGSLLAFMALGAPALAWIRRRTSGGLA